MFLSWVLILLSTLCKAKGYSKGYSPDKRVIGGEEAPEGSRPYQVSVSVYEKLYDRADHFCGGTILSEQWVLSASQCTEHFPASQLLIIAGTNKLSEGGVRYEIDEIINHDYNSDSGEGDISLIKIQDKFKFSDKIAAIKLPTSDTEPGTTCVVSGWGISDLNDEYNPEKLLMVTMKTISVKECKEKFDNANDNPLTITENDLCTVTKNEAGSCYGDTGGPLTANNVVIGVVSRSACVSKDPEVYTRVFKYIDWIKDNMQ